jgi:hypothetical protein
MGIFICLYLSKFPRDYFFLVSVNTPEISYKTLSNVSPPIAVDVQYYGSGYTTLYLLLNV